MSREPLRIVAGRKEIVGTWLLARLPEINALPGGYEAVGVLRGDDLAGGVLFTNYVPCEGGADLQMWAAGHDWISRRVIRELLGYPFRQLRCHRITAIVAKRNRKSRRLVTGLGFKLEGVARHGMKPGSDACLYSLLKDEFQERWGDAAND